MNFTLIGFLKKEFAQGLRDRRMRVLIFILPSLQLIVFGLAIRTEMRNIRLAVFGKPDPLLREITTRAEASGWFIPAKVRGNNPYQWAKSGEAEAILVSPEKGLGRDAKRGTANLQILIDASDSVRARIINAYLSSIIRQADKDPAPQFSFSIRTLYNPELKTAHFMVPSISGLILSILTIILTSMSLAREKEIGTMETILSAPIEGWEILLGKTIPFVAMGLIVFTLVISAGILVFGVPERGPLWMLGLSGLVFVVTSVAIGLFISTIAKNQQQAMMASFIFLFPAMQLSGITFPVDNLPPSIAWVSYFDPLKYFVTLMRNIMLKGGNPTVFWENLAAIALIGTLVALFAVERFHDTLN